MNIHKTNYLINVRNLLSMGYNIHNMHQIPKNTIFYTNYGKCKLLENNGYIVKIKFLSK